MIATGLSEGTPESLGVTATRGGVNVAVFSANATAIEFCLFDAAGEQELRRIILPARSGDIRHGHIAGIALGARYGLRAHGAYLPQEGHRFNPAKLLIDPYARALDRCLRLHPSMLGADDVDSAPAMAKCVVMPDDPAGHHPSPVAWAQTVLYELHVRGFTMRHQAIPAELRGRFAGLAHPAAIAHLVKLGVTSVELMPCSAWIEEPHLAARGLANYWGYNPVAWLAPDPRLAPGGWAEVAATTAALAAAGIETIVDVVLNHTGEGDALGPTLSLRGLDNASYYHLHPDAPERYIDDSGCGNTVALDRPPALRLAMDTLRVWALRGGIHGFRFDLATTMGRRADGFDPAAPLLAAIAQDPVLRDLKLIAEPWDIGPGGHQIGRFPPLWGEWNDRFRDDIRRFWRGDAGLRGALATRLAGSSDVFSAKRHPSRGVNFITAHDGFTLADLVAYRDKHNAANAEDNRDGTDANYAWNNGAEGATDDAAINAHRLQDQRCLLATLLLARGTPMLAMGAELGHSQAGNNNAYAQDNATTWIDWDNADQDLIAWTRRLIALRRAHPALHDDRFLTPDDVAWCDAEGRTLEGPAWETPPDHALTVVLTYAGDAQTPMDRVALLFNRGWDGVDIIPPPAASAHAWEIVADSAAPQAAAMPAPADTLRVAARALVVLHETPDPARRSTRGAGASHPLDTLARAAGIAGEWWEVDGTRHVVGDDTRRALLAGMGLPATDDATLRDTIAALAETRDRRALPHAVTMMQGGIPTIPIPLAEGLNRRPVWLAIALEDGTQHRVRIARDQGTLASAVAVDGRRHQLWSAPLPALPIGRHRLWREDAPDTHCHLTVAPARCHMPDALQHGGRRFGVSAQLYSVRRDGDQGIGDFTTLCQLGEAGAQRGASLIGLNPLHALFSAQRERASPYHPSDRRFLDPIYLDVTRLGEGEATRMTHDLLQTTAPVFARLGKLDHVDYPNVWAAKLPILERFFRAFDDFARRQPNAAPARDFAAFRAAGGDALRAFATFEALSERFPAMAWQHWPDEFRRAEPASLAAFANTNATRLRFHQFLQFLCDLQLQHAAETARKAGLEGGFLRDLAVGAAPDGAEAWCNATLLANGASIGAPPDPFAPQGQIWALPPPNPMAMQRTGFAAFAALLRANMRHAGALRIDHVMGLSRLFWVPDGGKGADGSYVSYPLHDLLGQLALESQRANCLVVGEDLGTVPEGFRETLAQADILSFRVLLLEREGHGFTPPQAYPKQALACLSTHDLPTLAGWWEGADITERRDLGLLDADSADAALHEREDERAALTAMVHADPSDALVTTLPADIAVAAHAAIGETPSQLVLIQAEDLAGERESVNLPGTDRERPNWRRRLHMNIEDALGNDTARAIFAALTAARATPDEPD